MSDQPQEHDVLLLPGQLDDLAKVLWATFHTSMFKSYALDRSRVEDRWVTHASEHDRDRFRQMALALLQQLAYVDKPQHDAVFEELLGRTAFESFHDVVNPPTWATQDSPTQHVWKRLAVKVSEAAVRFHLRPLSAQIWCFRSWADGKLPDIRRQIAAECADLASNAERNCSQHLIRKGCQVASEAIRKAFRLDEPTSPLQAGYVGAGYDFIPVGIEDAVQTDKAEPCTHFAADWRFSIGGVGTECGSHGPNEGRTTVREHVTCHACLKAMAPTPPAAVEGQGEAVEAERLLDLARLYCTTRFTYTCKTEECRRECLDNAARDTLKMPWFGIVARAAREPVERELVRFRSCMRPIVGTSNLWVVDELDSLPIDEQLKRLADDARTLKTELDAERTARDAAEQQNIELKKRLEWFRAAHMLIAQDEMFAGPKSEGPFIHRHGAATIVDGEPALYLLCGDIFAYACADAERVDYADTTELLRIGVEEGWPGLVRWIQSRRHHRGDPADPILPVRERMASMDSLRQHAGAAEHRARTAELERANISETLASERRKWAIANDPQWDGTDAAHPAWWRGQDSGTEGAVMRIRAVLDDKDAGDGVLGSESLEKLRRDVIELSVEAACYVAVCKTFGIEKDVIGHVRRLQETAARKLAKVEADRDHLKRREATIVEALKPADGGTFVNDIVGAVERLVRDRDTALAAVSRLQAVIDTHDLCHNLHGGVDVRAFADGCTAEQRKLYGCAPDADELAQLRAEIDSIWDAVDLPVRTMTTLIEVFKSLKADLSYYKQSLDALAQPTPPEPGTVWQHFKGRLYRILPYDRDADTNHLMVSQVRYAPVDADPSEEPYNRRLSEWYSWMIRPGYTGPRFVPVDSSPKEHALEYPR